MVTPHFLARLLLAATFFLTASVPCAALTVIVGPPGTPTTTSALPPGAAAPVPAATAPAASTPAATPTASAATAKPKADIVPAAVPDATTQAAARTVVLEVYKDDMAAAFKPDDKVALARKLLQVAGETRNDLPGQFVLISIAKDLAVTGRDADVAIAAVNEMATFFDVEPLSLKVETLGKVLAEATRVKDTVLITKVTTQISDLKEAKASYDKIAGSMTVLKTKPADPTANLEVGKFHCFCVGDWDKGLPMLVLGSDAALKSLAQKDQAKPAEPDKQLDLADGWWDVAQKQTGVMQSTVQKHAAEWYEKALPGLTGLSKVKVEKRLQSMGAKDPGGAWTVLFRSSDPSIWNKEVNKGPSVFAVPLLKAPAGVQFLKMTTTAGAQVIIPMTNELLPMTGPVGSSGKYVWYGQGNLKFGAYHLGIYDKSIRKSSTQLRGTVGIWAGMSSDNYSGWGFGSYVGFDTKQCYAWEDKEILPTVFEISVKAAPLTDAEKKFLLD